MKKGMDFRWVGSVMVLRERKAEPTDADWDAFLGELRQRRGATANVRIVVFTDGGGPNASQRGRISSALGGEPVRAAVVTDSTFARFIVSSVALVNRSIRTFSMSEAAQAYRYLELTPAEVKLVEAARDEMNDTVA